MQTLLNDGIEFALDKDILHKGNKMYGPDFCSLVPRDINALFTKNDAIRGNYPIGVILDKKCGKFRARLKVDGNYRNLGSHFTLIEAFEAYKKAKEAYIKELAQPAYNAGHIVKRCYDAMMNYEVEITD